jgi:hypothetical protein
MCKRQPSTNRNLRTNNTIASVKALGKHMHGSTFSIGNALAASEEFANDRFHGSAAQEREAVAAVGGDNVVFLGEGVLDADGDGFLAGGEMAETADLLFFVESVGGHFHAADERSELASPSAKIEAIEKGGTPTEQKPYHNTSSSAPSSSYQGYTAADPTHTSQTTHPTGGPGTVYRLPISRPN